MHCFEKCIPTAYLLPEQQMERALEIAADIGYYKQTGRPPIDAKRVLHALYYIVRTGIQWCALPRCFGPASTVHSAFQRLADRGFFENFFLEGLDDYDKAIGLDLHRKVGDCSHAKSPIGKDSVGPSPVDRRKQGTKRSIITDGNGVLLGCVVASGSRNDAKLLRATIQSVPSQFQSDGSHKIWLDAIYDTQEVRDICFEYGLRPQISSNPHRKKSEPIRSIQKGVRWVVERTHSWINRFRHISTRFDKSTDNYLAFIKFAATTLTFSKLRVSG